MKSKKFDEYSFTLKEIDESKRKAIMVSPEIGKKIKANFFLKIGKEKIENENRGKFEIRRRNENQRTSRSRRIKIFTQDSSVSSRNQSLDRRELSWLKDPLLLKKRSVKKIQRIFMQEKVELNQDRNKPMKPKYGSCSNINCGTGQNILKNLISKGMKKIENTPKTAAFSSDKGVNCVTPNATKNINFRNFYRSPDPGKSPYEKGVGRYKTPQPRRPKNLFSSPFQKKMNVSSKNILKNGFNPSTQLKIDSIIGLNTDLKKIKKNLEKENIQEFRLRSFKKLFSNYKPNSTRLSNSRAYSSSKYTSQDDVFLGKFLQHVKKLRQKRTQLFNENLVRENEIKNLSRKIEIEKNNHFKKINTFLELKSKINLNNDIDNFRSSQIDKKKKNLKDRNSLEKKELDKLIFEEKLLIEHKSRHDFWEQLYINYLNLKRIKDPEIENLIKRIKILKSKKCYIERYNPR